MKTNRSLFCGFYAVLWPVAALMLAAQGKAAEADNAAEARVVFPNTTVNGHPARTVLDTGSGWVMVADDPAASRFGLKDAAPFTVIKGEFVALDIEVPMALSEFGQMTFGAQTFTSPLIVMKESTDFDALIGWLEVRDNLLVFDAAQRTVGRVDEVPPDMKEALKLEVKNDPTLLIKTALPDGKEGLILVDTGDEDGVGLPSAQWKEWKAAHPAASVSNLTFGGLAGSRPVAVEAAWADEIKIGALTLANVPVHELPASEVKNAGNLIAVLGLSALSRVDLVVDAKNGLAYLRPKAAGEPTKTGEWTVTSNVRLNNSPMLALSALENGDFKMKEGDYDGALNYINQAIELDPSNAGAYGIRGVTKANQGDYNGAMADFNHALELDPNYADGYSTRGGLKAKMGDYDGALADLNHALELDPKNAEAYSDRGATKLYKHDLDGGISDLNRALQLDPKNAEDYSNRGGARLKQGDLDGAMADLNHALELDPKNADAYGNRGIARQKKGDWDGAIADFSHLLELDPKNTATYDNRGNAKEYKGDYDGAIADFSRAAELNPQNADFFSDRGYVKGFKGDYDGAFADFNHAIALDPKSDDAYNGLGVVKQLQGDSSGAMVDYDETIALTPDDSEYPRFYRELLQLQLGKAPADFKDAVASWKAGWPKSIGQFLTGGLDEAALLAAAEKPGDEPVIGQQCEAYYYIGMMRLLKNDPAGARDSFQKCVATGVMGYNEYQFARVELARLDTAAKKPSP